MDSDSNILDAEHAGRRPFSLQSTPWWAAASFIFITATLCHLVFSRFGFNLADDGFIMAGARRILDGQIPHLDFISIRPAGSHFLYVPFVAFGGDYAIWIARYFVWFQFAAISWCGVLIAGKIFKTFDWMPEKVAVGIIALCFTANGFPVMPWHIIDSLFFSSIGLFLCICRGDSKFLKTLGYLALGAAPLFRLNFLPLAVAAPILLGDWKKLRCWIAIALPICLYMLYLSVHGAVPAAVSQITTYSSFLRAGFERYASNKYNIIGVFVGLAAIIMADGASPLPRSASQKVRIAVKTAGAFLLLAIPMSQTVDLIIFPRTFGEYSFLSFGAVVGMAAYLLFRDARQKKIAAHTTFTLLALAMAWCSSISIGYNYMALGLGLLSVVPIGFAFYALRLENGGHEAKNLPKPLRAAIKRNAAATAASIFIAIMLVSTVLVFHDIRKTYLYLDREAEYLDYEIDGLFPGARMIKTGENTHKFLADLQEAKGVAAEKGKRYCILSDCPGNWIKDPQPNPLCIDWPQYVELGRSSYAFQYVPGNSSIINQTIENLSSQKSDIIVLLQKYNVFLLAWQFVPSSNPPLEDVIMGPYVRSNFNKTWENQCFEIYE
jgi:hypothetical protein